MVDSTVHSACGPPIVNLGARLPAATDRLLLQWGTTANPMGCLFQRVGPGITSAFLRLRPSTSPRSAFSSSILIAIDNEYSSLKSAGGHRQTCIYDEVAQQKTAPPLEGLDLFTFNRLDSPQLPAYNSIEVPSFCSNWYKERGYELASR